MHAAAMADRPTDVDADGTDSASTMAAATSKLQWGSDPSVRFVGPIDLHDLHEDDVDFDPPQPQVQGTPDGLASIAPQ
jgi:hypothetical protein